jgi:hypothetical protein
MFDLATLFWTSVGITSLILVLLDYILFRKKKAKVEAV